MRWSILSFVFCTQLISTAYALDSTVTEWLDNNPGDPAYTTTVEYLLKTVNNTKELQLLVDRYLPHVTQPADRSRLLYFSARIFELWGNISQAVQTFRTAYTIEPKNEYLYRAALLLLEIGDIQASEQLLETLSKSSPNLEGYKLLRIRQKDRDTENYLSEVAKIAAAENARVSEIYYYFSLLYQHGRQEEAEKQMLYLKKVYPNTPEAAIAEYLVAGVFAGISEFPSLSRVLHTLQVEEDPLIPQSTLLSTKLSESSEDKNIAADKQNEDSGSGTKKQDDRILVGLQVASFVKKDNAEALQLKLRKKELPTTVHIMPVHTGTKSYYRVIISYDAEQFADQNEFFTTMLEYNIEGILLYD